MYKDPHCLSGVLRLAVPLFIHSFILLLVVEHLLCTRPLWGTEYTVVDDRRQPGALPGAALSSWRCQIQRHLASGPGEASCQLAVCGGRAGLSSGSPLAVGMGESTLNPEMLGLNRAPLGLPDSVCVCVCVCVCVKAGVGSREAESQCKHHTPS